MFVPEDSNKKAWAYLDVLNAAHMVEPGRGVKITIDGKEYVLLDAETYDRMIEPITHIKLL